MGVLFGVLARQAAALTITAVLEAVAVGPGLAAELAAVFEASGEAVDHATTGALSRRLKGHQAPLVAAVREWRVPFTFAPQSAQRHNT